MNLKEIDRILPVRGSRTGPIRIPIHGFVAALIDMRHLKEQLEFGNRLYRPQDSLASNKIGLQVLQGVERRVDTAVRSE